MGSEAGIVESTIRRREAKEKMAVSRKTLCLVAILAAIFACCHAFPGPQPAGPAAAARIQARDARSAEATDLKTDSSYGFGYAYPYSYGYGYPYGYSYSYPSYGYGSGYYGYVGYGAYGGYYGLY